MSLKAKARAYFAAVSAYDVAAVKKMLNEHYIQHNPFVPTGRAAFLALLPKLKEHGSTIENVRILEDGSFVIMHHKWHNAAPFGYAQAAAFHIIRFDRDAKIVEHWNVMTDDTGNSLTLGSTQIADLHLTAQNKDHVSDLIGTFIAGAHPNADLEYCKLHKVFGEGNFVVSISEGQHAGTHSAIYDLFHIQGDKPNDKFGEHWQITQPIPTQNLANDNTMFGF